MNEESCRDTPPLNPRHHPSPRDSVSQRTLLDTGSMAGDFVSKSFLVSLDALTHCYVSSQALNVCSGLNGTCYRCNTLVDLGLTFLDDSNIKHTIYITFAQLDLIIGRKSFNHHNLFVLRPTRMGFDPTLVEPSHSPDDIELSPTSVQIHIPTSVVIIVTLSDRVVLVICVA